MRLDRENDPNILRQAALLLEKENGKLIAKVVELQREIMNLRGIDPSQAQLRIAQLEQLLANQTKKVFGDSSERRNDKGDGGEVADAKPSKPGHGPREQPHLAVIELTHRLDEADKACPKCGGALAEMDGQFEESEEVDVVERTFVLRKHLRQKYRCACNACIDTALGPAKLFPNARYSIDFAVEVATQKYLDHLPLARQVRVMTREGLAIDSQTLWDQTNALARWLEPVAAALRTYILTKPVIGMDETHWRLMGANGEDEGISKRWQVWALAGPDAVCYQILGSRGKEAARKVLGEYAGVLITDGYDVYDSLAREPKSRFVLANCWSHVRRKFVDVETAFPDEAKQALQLIAELYGVEAACSDDVMRAALRDQRSRAIVSRIQAWALATLARTLPQSGLGRAIAYMTGLWKGLTRFLGDARIPLDNNGTERAIRGLVVGRKNHYGSRSERGTVVAALFYTVIESAKLAGVDAKEYLRYVANASAREQPVLLPHAYRTNRAVEAS